MSDKAANSRGGWMRRALRWWMGGNGGRRSTVAAVGRSRTKVVVYKVEKETSVDRFVPVRAPTSNEHRFNGLDHEEWCGAEQNNMQALRKICRKWPLEETHASRKASAGSWALRCRRWRCSWCGQLTVAAASSCTDCRQSRMYLVPDVVGLSRYDAASIRDLG